MQRKDDYLDSLSPFKMIVPFEADDDCEVAFDIVPVNAENDSLKSEIDTALNNLDNEIDGCMNQIDELNNQIEFLTNHSDKLDIIVSAASGIITASLDAIFKEIRLKNAFNGDFDGKDLLDFLNIDGSNTVNNELNKIKDREALKKAVDKSIETGNSTVGTNKIADDSIKGIISFLEDRFNIPGDSLTSKFGGSKQHHLRDFSHHPSIAGLVFSMITQFTMKCYGTDTQGNFKVEELNFIEGKEGRIAKAGKEIKVIGENVGEKILFGTVFWFFHLISDMAGSSNTPGAGMGIPGPILSFAKEISALPIFRKKDKNGNKEFSVWLSKLYNGTLFAKTDENGNLIKRKIDMRTEVGAIKELGKEALPILLNEFIVRGFYFVRRFVNEIKTKNIQSFSDLRLVDVVSVLPFKNRTVIRMLTVATGSFTATNLAVAAAISGAKSGGNTAAFASGFVMRINFVGVARFAVAIGSDISSGVKKSKLENEKFSVENKMIFLLNAKICYLNADALLTISNIESGLVDVFDAEEKMWIAAKNADEAINEMVKTAMITGKYFAESYLEISENTNKIVDHVNEIEKRNPGFNDKFKNMLKW